MKSVRLAITEDGLTGKRILTDTLGGAERFFMLFEKYLVKAGYAVSRWPELPEGRYDLCVHANFFDGRVTAGKHLLWGGGWEVGPYAHLADEVVILTNYMKERFGWEDSSCKIIPAPFDHDLLQFKTSIFTPRRIVSNSNPSRFFPHMVAVASHLDKMGVEYDWHFCGGSKLYAPHFQERYDFYNGHPRLFHRGVLSRKAMVDMLNDGHVLVYPSFDDDLWETQGVAFLEAAALGLPVVLTNKRPFTDVMPEARFCSNAEEMAETIATLFESVGRVVYPKIGRYDSDVIFEQLISVVKDMIGGP